MGAPRGNKNAELWTYEEAEKLFEEAVLLSKSTEYDFVGEIARDMEIYRELFDYLANKFPDLSCSYSLIKKNCEANCFSNAKKGKIKEASAIINLKSNFGWTDRVHEEKEGELIIRVHRENKRD